MSVSESFGTGSASVAGGGTDTFSGIQTFKGSSEGGNVFTVGAGSATFEGGGGSNELTLASDPEGITIDLGAGTIATANGTDDFSDIQILVGSASGQNYFIGGPGDHTLEAGGTGNTLDYSSAPGPVTIDATGTASPLPDSAQNGFGGTDSFSGIQTFIGSDGGGNAFISNGANGLTFTGEGANNSLDLSTAPTGLQINAAGAGGGTVVDGSNVEDFSDIQNFKGSTGGDTDFVAGSAGGLTFTGQGAGNTLDFSGASGPTTINTVAGTAQAGSGGTDSFSDIQNFVGSGSGDTTFISDGAGGLTFTGEGTNNTLDLSAAIGPVTLDLAAGTAKTSLGVEQFSDIQTFKVSAASGGVDLAGIGEATTFSYDPGSQTLTLLGGTQTVQLDIGPPPSGDDFSLAGDGAGGTLVTVTSVAAPTISAPAAATIGVGQAAAISGVSLAGGDSQDAGESFTATLSDASGDLTVSSASVTVSGDGTTSVMITGSLAAVNAALASLSDKDTTSGSDTITVSASDGLGNTAAQQTIAVTVNGDPAISVPGAQTIGQGQAATIGGISIAEAGKTTTSGETFSATITDTNGDLTATGFTGSATSISLGGVSLATLNTDLASLKDTDGAAGTDTIKVNVTDSFGNAASQETVGVTVNGLPAIAVPGSQTIGVGKAATIGGISVAETGNTSGTETFSATITDTNCDLTAAGFIGSATSISLSGVSLATLNTDLASLKDTDTTAGSDTIRITLPAARGPTSSSPLPARSAPATPPSAAGRAMSWSFRAAGRSIWRRRRRSPASRPLPPRRPNWARRSRSSPCAMA